VFVLGIGFFFCPRGQGRLPGVAGDDVFAAIAQPQLQFGTSTQKPSPSAKPGQRWEKNQRYRPEGKRNQSNSATFIDRYGFFCDLHTFVAVAARDPLPMGGCGSATSRAGFSFLCCIVVKSVGSRGPSPILRFAVWSVPAPDNVLAGRESSFRLVGPRDE